MCKYCEFDDEGNCVGIPIIDDTHHDGITSDLVITTDPDTEDGNPGLLLSIGYTRERDGTELEYAGARINYCPMCGRKLREREVNLY